jgi:hypothetical protein
VPEYCNALKEPGRVVVPAVGDAGIVEVDVLVVAEVLLDEGSGMICPAPLKSR